MAATTTAIYTDSFFRSEPYQLQATHDAYLEFAYNSQANPHQSRISQRSILASKLSMLSPAFQDLFDCLAFQLAYTIGKISKSDIMLDFTRAYVRGHTRCRKLSFHAEGNNHDHGAENVAADVERRQEEGSSPGGILEFAEHSILDSLLSSSSDRSKTNHLSSSHQGNFNLCATIEEILDTAPLVAISKLRTDSIL